MMQSTGLRASMSRKGDWYDNAPMESFFHMPKTQLVHHRHYATGKKPHVISLPMWRASIIERVVTPPSDASARSKWSQKQLNHVHLFGRRSIFLAAGNRAQSGVKPSNYLTRSRRAGCQHPIPEQLDPGYGVGEFGLLCYLPESVHFFRIDPPCVAIPDVSHARKWYAQPLRSAADGCLHLVPGRARFGASPNEDLRFIDRGGVWRVRQLGCANHLIPSIDVYDSTDR
jgi:hypothetical protein